MANDQSFDIIWYRYPLIWKLVGVIVFLLIALAAVIFDVRKRELDQDAINCNFSEQDKSVGENLPLALDLTDSCEVDFVQYETINNQLAQVKKELDDKSSILESVEKDFQVEKIALQNLESDLRSKNSEISNLTQKLDKQAQQISACIAENSILSKSKCSVQNEGNTAGSIALEKGDSINSQRNRNLEEYVFFCVGNETSFVVSFGVEFNDQIKEFEAPPNSTGRHFMQKSRIRNSDAFVMWYSNLTGELISIRVRPISHSGEPTIESCHLNDYYFTEGLYGQIILNTP